MEPGELSQAPEAAQGAGPGTDALPTPAPAPQPPLPAATPGSAEGAAPAAAPPAEQLEQPGAPALVHPPALPVHVGAQPGAWQPALLGVPEVPAAAAPQHGYAPLMPQQAQLQQLLEQAVAGWGPVDEPVPAVPWQQAESDEAAAAEALAGVAAATAAAAGAAAAPPGAQAAAGAAAAQPAALAATSAGQDVTADRRQRNREAAARYRQRQRQQESELTAQLEAAHLERDELLAEQERLLTRQQALLKMDAVQQDLHQQIRILCAPEGPVLTAAVGSAAAMRANGGPQSAAEVVVETERTFVEELRTVVSADSPGAAAEAALRLLPANFQSALEADAAAFVEQCGQLQRQIYELVASQGFSPIPLHPQPTAEAIKQCALLVSRAAQQPAVQAASCMHVMP